MSEQTLTELLDEYGLFRTGVRSFNGSRFNELERLISEKMYKAHVKVRANQQKNQEQRA